MKRSRSSHPPADTAFSPGLRRLAWLNIAVQAAFPLAVAFTPVMAGAGQQHFLQQRAPLSAQRTQVYTLGAGETAASVAKKFHLTLDQLRELNQFRVFAHGLNGLQPGDDVDVPLITAKDKKAASGASTASPSSEDSSASAQASDEQAQKVAGYASQAGSFLAGSAKSDAAASMARGMATGEAGGALQQWLSHFGTARVQLDADKNFSLKNSQFDLLMPLYDQGDNLVLTQGSLHRTDGRTQANLGAGLRHFTPTYMVGGNLFGDYDLSRDHARMGAGLEYWRDFLKLGANGYMRLTGWKDSPDLADYQERPANGWDIRAQAWLPSLPQLGGKLTYEQYYGKEVALFGVDNRQKNPHAITGGINYTPVPLITLGAEQRQGQSGKSDTRLTVDMNYQLGVPWRNQVDPAAVAAMRSLTGSRYDLVERNNNIVLEYRKKEVIRLKTADLVTGYPGEQKSLGVSVTSTYGLSRIDWDASALSAAGGKIVQNGSDYAVVLPAYQTTTQAVNTYTVSGVAVDTKGNRSERSDTQVTVQAPEMNKQTSTFTPVSSVLPADGKSTQVLTLTLRDENNQAVDMDVKDISLKNSTLKSATVSALTRKSAGVYTVTVTAGTDVETVTLTPSVSGVTLSPAGVTISSTTPDAGQSVFTASPETIAADNTTISTLTLVAKDAQGNALTGLKDSLAFTVKDSGGRTPASGIITESAITESSTAGTYTATLKGTTAGHYTVVPEYSGNAMGSLSATVTLTDTLPDEKTSTIRTDTTTYVAGTDMLITVTLKDKNGTALTGDAGLLTTSTVTVPNATLKTGSSWKDSGDGTYTATYTAETMSTDNQATLKLSGWTDSSTSEKYAITLEDEAPASINTQVNAYTFTQTSEEGTFPTTGFTGATFTIVPKDGKSATDYTWTSDASWVSVASGVVKFTGTGTGSKVTITGTPTSGQGKIIKYSFTLNSWFINDGNTLLTWSDANTYCSSQSGYSLPTVAQITLHTNYTATTARGTGALWNEWGNLGSYRGAGFSGGNSWSSEQKNSGRHYLLLQYTGHVYSYYDSSTYYVVCRQGL
ncbi:inverse autotransporter beta domain-containing protein [Salmonella enterica]|nr:invasin [Salmonella enterica]EHG3238237.1 invasin [Salmonella enterica]EHR7011268.1 inverse autotransporter beta domain-containing protein [Salmonella enterica]